MFDYLTLKFTDDKLEKRYKKQRKWREEQLDIFYRTGKPIFRVSLDTMHIRSNINPNFFIEKPKWET